MAHKPLPLWALIPLDAALVASSLLTFAYFHHVRKTVTKPDEDLLEYIDHLNQNSLGNATVSIQEVTDVTTSTTAQTAQSGDVTDVTTGDGTTDGTATTAPQGSQTPGTGSSANQGGQPGTSGNGGNPGGTTSVTTTPRTTTVTTTTGPQYDLSGFGAKWPTLFSLGNEVEVTDTSYRSHNIYINITSQSYAGSNCHIADIYLRSTDAFKYAFAQDGDPNTYANGLVTGLQENMITMCDRTNAILAINGDFMGGRQYGYVIRDGYPWRTEPWGDVAALYSDGVVETFSKSEFDVYAAFDRGIKHSFAFGPALVRNGAVQSGFTAKHLTGKEPRSGFGYYEPGHYCFVAVDGRDMGGSAGMTAEEFAQYFGTLGCYQAFNLDGGKTSQLVFMGNVVNYPDGYNGKASSLRGMSDIYYIGEAN
ncbi:MAG: phosphodiester glycosidase family protein [Oscillospiraceae bacterium]|nr:phosphodiester glycosidase family protein [Oscillospiraceae bacterium]